MLSPLFVRFGVSLFPASAGSKYTAWPSSPLAAFSVFALPGRQLRAFRCLIQMLDHAKHPAHDVRFYLCAEYPRLYAGISVFPLGPSTYTYTFLPDDKPPARLFPPGSVSRSPTAAPIVRNRKSITVCTVSRLCSQTRRFTCGGHAVVSGSATVHTSAPASGTVNSAAPCSSS